METAAIGGTAKGGICRLTLTDLDRHVRDWFRRRGRSARLHRHRRRHGRDVRAARRPAVGRATDRHRQPPRHAAHRRQVRRHRSACWRRWRSLRTLHEAGYETYAPIEVVNWTNEEGSRFTPAMLASGVFAKVFTRDWAYARTDPAGATFGEALDGHRLSRRRSAAATTRCRRSSSCTSSRGRSWRPKAGGRRRHRRAGHALVRGDGHRAGRAHRRHADAAAQECAAGRARRSCRSGRDRARACAARGGNRGLDASQAELAQRGAGRGVPDHRSAPSRRRRAGGRWRTS